MVRKRVQFEQEEEKKSSSSSIGPRKSYKKERKDHGRIRSVEGEEDEALEQFNEKGDRIVAFNLKEEQQEGHFDGDGNFVWRREERQVQEDAWLENVTSKEITHALEAKKARLVSEEEEKEIMTQDSSIQIILDILKPHESVLKALKRLGGQKKGPPMDKAKFNQLTEAADYMMRIGVVDIYQHEREKYLTKQPIQKTIVYDGKELVESLQWEYKGEDGKTHGPYWTKMVIAWQKQGYFTGKSAVMMRKVKPEVQGTSAAEDLMNDFDDEEQEEDWHNSDTIDFHSFT